MSFSKKKVLSVSDVIDKDRRYFPDRNRNVHIVKVFFEEVLKLLIAGNEIRFPKKGNGKLSLVVKHKTKKDIIQLQYLESNSIPSDIKNVFKGSVKPVFKDFDVHTGGRINRQKKFTLRFAYLRSTISKLKKEFADDSKRRKLPEIE